MWKSNVQRALLVDFAGTLFLPLDGKQWAMTASRKARADLAPHEITELAALLDSRFQHVRDPGRDLSPAAHRQSMLPVLESLVTDKTLARSLYDLQFKDEFWHLRNGAQDLLCGARNRQLRVIVVSNVPWDIRPLFTRAGLRDHIHWFILSFEVGSEKPDKPIFERAIDLAGCAPSEAVFVGDDPVTDSGALRLGIPVILIPPCRDSTDQSLSMIARWLLSTSQNPQTT
jgi:HAD superfamily hydrolase (TIGR01509 family)